MSIVKAGPPYRPHIPAPKYYIPAYGNPHKKSQRSNRCSRGAEYGLFSRFWDPKLCPRKGDLWSPELLGFLEDHPSRTSHSLPQTLMKPKATVRHHGSKPWAPAPDEPQL